MPPKSEIIFYSSRLPKIGVDAVLTPSNSWQGHEGDGEGITEFRVWKSSGSNLYGLNTYPSYEVVVRGPENGRKTVIGQFEEVLGKPRMVFDEPGEEGPGITKVVWEAKK